MFSLLVSLKKIYSFISSGVICQTLKCKVTTISSNANWSSVINIYLYYIKLAFFISENCTCFKTPSAWLRLWLGRRARGVKNPATFCIMRHRKRSAKSNKIPLTASYVFKNGTYLQKLEGTSNLCYAIAMWSYLATSSYWDLIRTNALFQVREVVKTIEHTSHPLLIERVRQETKGP